MVEDIPLNFAKQGILWDNSILLVNTSKEHFTVTDLPKISEIISCHCHYFRTISASSTCNSCLKIKVIISKWCFNTTLIYKITDTDLLKYVLINAIYWVDFV